MSTRRWVGTGLVLLVWLLIGGAFGQYQGRLTEVQQNDAAAFLPGNAEATEVNEAQPRFVDKATVPAVIVYQRRGGFQLADINTVNGDLARINASGLAVEPLSPVLPSQYGEVAQVIVQLEAADGDTITAQVEQLRDIVGHHGGLTAHVAGPAAIIADVFEAFGAIDGLLIGVTALVVAVILLIVYRSPVLPLLVLVTVGLALVLSAATVFWLTRRGTLALNGQAQGILSVLVFGATTDYALLLVSRYREELFRHEDRWSAMRATYRGAFEPIVASGGTVVVGLLCLLFSDLASNRNLGPIGAIGIVSSLLASLTFLPAALLLLGRGAFWPRRPDYLGADANGIDGLWARIAGAVGRRHRRVWLVTTAGLLVAVALAPSFRAHGVAQTDTFLSQTDAVQGEELLDAYYPATYATPAIVLARANRLDAVVRTAAATPGVVAVTPFTGDLVPLPGAKPKPPRIVNDWVLITVVLKDSADSRQAFDTVRRLRTQMHAIEGAQAQVGGYTATQLDIRATTSRDLRTIVPIVLAVIFVILALLLRALVAPLLLIATVVVSFGATLGVGAVVFNHVLHFPGADAAVPLFAFVFLVALGIDYNIFLMTRVREEAIRHGTRQGTLTGLRVTGGVITSAGVVLAATFAALSVLPILFLVQMAFLVGFGVLLDTMIVRSLLVPALALEVGRWIWWPARLAFRTRPAVCPGDGPERRVLERGERVPVVAEPPGDGGGQLGTPVGSEFE